MLTWKNVGVSKVSVIYIYIYIDKNNNNKCLKGGKSLGKQVVKKIK